MDTYDITREMHYCDSFSYLCELRVLRDTALIDLLALDKERVGFSWCNSINYKAALKSYGKTTTSIIMTAMLFFASLRFR